jgi:hypothetical protein
LKLGLLQRRVVSSGVVTLVLALLALLLPSASARPRMVSMPRCSKPTTEPGVRRYSVREPASSSPQNLPSKLAKKARTEVEKSAVMRKLLKGGSFRITHEGAWTNRQSTHLLGAVLFLRLANRTNMSGGWPYSHAHFKSGRDYYVVRKVSFAMNGVRHLTVDVDAKAVSVVDVIPEDGTSPNCP